MLLSFFLMYTFPRNLNININFFDSDLAWNWTIFTSPSWTMIFLDVFSWHSGNLRLNIFCTWVQKLLFADWKVSKEHNPIAARRCLCEDCWPDECAEELSGNFSVRRSNGCDRAATTPPYASFKINVFVVCSPASFHCVKCDERLGVKTQFTSCACCCSIRPHFRIIYQRRSHKVGHVAC